MVPTTFLLHQLDCVQRKRLTAAAATALPHAAPSGSSSKVAVAGLPGPPGDSYSYSYRGQSFPHYEELRLNLLDRWHERDYRRLSKHGGLAGCLTNMQPYLCGVVTSGAYPM